MTKRSLSAKDTIKPAIYHIRVEGQLDQSWSEWMEGMSITLVENGDTLLSGPVTDQSALYGLLAKIRDSNLKLLSVEKE